MYALVFDGRTGASGDMILGALLAAGATEDALTAVESSLPVEYHIDETVKNGIHATAVSVIIPGDDTQDADTDSHHHGHDHDHSLSHDHSHAHTHAEGHGPHRTYAECMSIVDDMDLPQAVTTDAKAIFTLLGEAEATVHGTDLADTHFHEVGADDAIADIVGAALLMNDLTPDHIYTTPVATGQGEISMSHGQYPIPPPAVMYLAEMADWEIYGGSLETELLTPTGAAILAHYATGVSEIPNMRIEQAGFGAGSKSFTDRPNVLRAIMGSTRQSLQRDEIRVLETNLDDATPEVLGSLYDTLREAGARDVSIIPITMKKSRPGHLVQVIVKPADVQQVAHTLAAETGTLGIRESSVGHRWIADREFQTVSLEIADESVDITVKIARDSAGNIYDVSTEFDEALRIASDTDMPVRTIIDRAEAAFIDHQSANHSDCGM